VPPTWTQAAIGTGFGQGCGASCMFVYVYNNNLFPWYKSITIQMEPDRSVVVIKIEQFVDTVRFKKVSSERICNYVSHINVYAQLISVVLRCLSQPIRVQSHGLEFRAACDKMGEAGYNHRSSSIGCDSIRERQAL
jgi:hypothetical protein